MCGLCNLAIHQCVTAYGPSSVYFKTINHFNSLGYTALIRSTVVGVTYCFQLSLYLYISQISVYISVNLKALNLTSDKKVKQLSRLCYNTSILSIIFGVSHLSCNKTRNLDVCHTLPLSGQYNS